MLAGTRSVEGLVARAAACGMTALALTDTDGLYAVVPFQRACEEAGIRPIYGAELTGPWGERTAKPQKGAPGKAGSGDTARAVLLARNGAGYRELSRLVTARHLERDFSLCDALAGISDDLYVLTGDGRVLRLLRGRPNVRAALPVALGREWDRGRWRLGRLAAELGLHTVAAGAVFFLDPGEVFVQRVLTAVRTRTTVGTLPPGEAAPPEAFFHTPHAVERVFRGDSAPFEEARRVAGDCRVELDLRTKKLPRFPVPPGETAATMLRKLAARGLAERLGGGRSRNGSGGCPSGVDAAEWRRAGETLDYELSVVRQKGLADYFLICWDIVRFARSRGMRSLGRGSAGNSLLSYALGITHVNPLWHNLFFERFLNPEREQLPDFDIDFATDDREEVLQYIFRRYGEERVAMIGACSTFRARSALRETARALGIPGGEVGPFIERIPFYASVDHLAEACAVSPAAAGIPFDREPLKSLMPLAVRIGGFPRHMTTHPCGLVIAPEPITHFMPLQRGEKGYAITQWSMYEVEEAGLVKIDIIGQKGLAVIEEAAAMAGENEGRPLHPERIDYLADAGAKRMLREGRTEGCFYIESPGMIQLIRQAKCDDFEVLTALSSIIRPGVSSYGGKQLYLLRHLGLEPAGEMYPAVADVLHDTHGCLIYQEQVIRIAVAVVGMSCAEADGLRRCMSYKNRDAETFESYRASFMRGALERGVPAETAGEIFRQISSFAGYAFCKAHSASFALESFESVYWKAHYPAEFMAAVLSNGGGYYSQEEYLEEARRMGLEIMPPCVNRSGFRHRGRGKRLRIGLMQVKGLTAGTAERIVAERPFRSLGDFLERVPAARDEVETLIRCGAMRSFGRTRPELLWEMHILWSEVRRGSGAARPRGTASGAGTLLGRIPRVPEYGIARSIALEMELLGLAVSAHPLAMFEREIAAAARGRRLTRSVDLPNRVGSDVELAGWKVTTKAARTMDRGEEMIFVTFSDSWGRYEATFFPRVYRRAARELFRAGGPFLVRGRVESELGVENLVASGVQLINGGESGAVRGVRAVTPVCR